MGTAVLDRDTPAPARSGVAASNAHRLVWLGVAFAVLVLIALASIAVGSKDIPLSTAIDSLLHASDSDDRAIIMSLRLPRTALGIMVGMALGLAGALIQALTRNPLADPGILGVNAGASFAVTIAVGVFGFSTLSGYIWFAFAGAILTTVLVYAIGSIGRGAATPIRLTLAGVAIGAVLSGVSSGLALLDPATFDRLRYWRAGSLAVPGFDDILIVAPFILAGVILAALVARPLNAVALGDDLAASLGANIMRTRAIVVVAVTLLAGAATAVAGPIGFIGLMVPHVARWISGPDQRWIAAFTLVLAPILLLGSDIIGRIIMRPGELQVGIVSAFVGAPVLILLARRRKVSGL
jgi:iron complex transport system permease protein